MFRTAKAVISHLSQVKISLSVKCLDLVCVKLIGQFYHDPIGSKTQV